MSVENLKEYARRCAIDPELRAVAKDIGMDDLDEHMRHAESMGLDWNRADLVAFRREITDPDGEFVDLTEEELAEIAGGGVTTTLAVVVCAAAGVAAGAVVGAAAGGAAAGAATSGSGGW